MRAQHGHDLGGKSLFVKTGPTAIDTKRHSVRLAAIATHGMFVAAGVFVLSAQASLAQSRARGGSANQRHRDRWKFCIVEVVLEVEECHRHADGQTRAAGVVQADASELCGGGRRGRHPGPTWPLRSIRLSLMV